MYRIGEEEVEEVRKVLLSGHLFRVGDGVEGHLHEVDQFEREWAQLVGTQYALCMAGGGTAALICGLVGMGIGPGDEVIVPGYTWMATATSVLAVGAIPVIAEVDETLALDPEDVRRKITPHTRAIIPVHMVGRPANLHALLEVAREHDLLVLEDCCQADGGSYRGKRLGSWGHAGAFSFNYFKIISCGEGGALTTDDRTLYERALVFHDGGASFRPYAKELSIPIFVGLQLRADEVMGAILRVQLRRLDGILSDLRRIRRRFEQELADVPGLRIAPNNDPEGDCGVVVAFQFDSEGEARAFAHEVGGWLPIDSGKHVYSNWEPLLHHRIWHHPDMNPFQHPRNQGLRTHYTPDMCPRTLDLLRRTVFLSLHPDWSEEEVSGRIEACRRAAKEAVTL
ncbi:MAG: DegT/DnrJ/EryC1/StrS family aminotransferase, partial [Armatimonadota bacterium]|nr:DegT/DnrJ/EryC1/StrS family aminotransferase [Armatimonadota bacterium]MDW8105205.1 DegT/DnrJ/EryC1/StrS family aminotransferase [Armatimonadota bacterium]